MKKLILMAAVMLSVLPAAAQEQASKFDASYIQVWGQAEKEITPDEFYLSVTIDGTLHSSIGAGLLLLVGIEEADTQEDIDYLAGKASRLRVFDDEAGVMNLDVRQTAGELLVVSQFTLHASTRKGNRPSYFRAAGEAFARPMYERFVAALAAASGRPVRSGEFGADMAVDLVYVGPVKIWIDSKNKE